MGEAIDSGAVLGITQYALRELLNGEMELRSFVQRLPVAMDLHSAYVHNRVDHDESFMLPPTVTADLSSNGSYIDCLLTSMRVDTRSLQRARNLRESMLKQGPWARRYAFAYGRYSEELARLTLKHPVLRQSLEATMQEALRLHDLERGSLLDHAKLIRMALPAVAIVRRRGSAELREAMDLALTHLPDLLAERARYAPAMPAMDHRIGSKGGGIHGR